MASKPKALIPPVGRDVLIPRNEEQAEYLTSLKKNSQTFCIGPAGSGKTYLPSAYAAELMIAGDIRQIIVCRPAVAAGGERLGFLPGSLEEKVAPWAWPIMDVLQERLGKQSIFTLMESGRIRFESFEYMRGRTFKDAFIILDEAQNTTVEQMKLFLTRIGENSKLAVTGDTNQSDIKAGNGLSYALGLIDRLALDVPVIELHDVERSPICALWSEAFSSQD